MNWLLGLVTHRCGRTTAGKRAVAASLMVNLALLAAFKYANFIVDSLNLAFLAVHTGPIELAPVHLPIGISFFTFQAMTYMIDVYRGDGEVQRNPATLGLYIALFPQLIAGPIVRYHHIARQLISRQTSWALARSGVERFVVGLAKKVLLADPAGAAADAIFALSGSDLSAGTAWVGIVSYAFQIYFDFSGYSDMAIGLGRIFGFRFLENFNYPYVAQSVTEFWRRWHISLSSWFRDYLYIPLGGNRI